MANESFQLRYLPLFEQDLLGTVDYITNVLQNEDAAQKLIDDVETAILKRLDNPFSFEPYHSAKKREYPYYRIYVRNYTIFYVVIGNVMEVRRLIYNARNIDSIL
ncbi:MAG: type II toxin-antitoxin system RelE/ParE family toxin [Lachnospiraceae bacterium]|nr:type II toxin-antitoxin system RelE/ParE family toxin [Lachnospiraceae bacterium]